MNKKGGVLAYIFWIMIGFGIGVWFALMFVC